MDDEIALDLVDVLKDIKTELKKQNERLNDIEYRLNQIREVV